MHKFKEHPKLKNEMVSLIWKMKQASQPLSTSIVQPILKSMLQSISFDFIEPKYGGFIVTSKWSK